MSAQHAYEARRAFALCVARGEAGVNLAEAALHIAAEDDALGALALFVRTDGFALPDLLLIPTPVSHSSVLFPVDAYLGRIRKMVDELARLRLAAIPPDARAPAEALEVVQKYLYEEQVLIAKSVPPASPWTTGRGVLLCMPPEVFRVPDAPGDEYLSLASPQLGRYFSLPFGRPCLRHASRHPPIINAAFARRPDVVWAAVTYTKCLRIPSSGKSNLPASAKVAHPGVWEEARHAYLNEALTRRVATPACLAILFSEIMQRLLERVSVGAHAVASSCTGSEEEEAHRLFCAWPGAVRMASKPTAPSRTSGLPPGKALPTTTVPEGHDEP